VRLWFIAACFHLIVAVPGPSPANPAMPAAAVAEGGPPGPPAAIFGGHSAALPGWTRDALASAGEYFTREAARFGLRPGLDSLEAVEQRAERGLRHVRLRQRYRGLPVVGGEYMLTATESGELRMISGHVITGLDVETRPRVTVAEARSTAASAWIGFSPAAIGESPLVIHAGPSGAALAYAVELSRPDGFTATAYVDAQNAGLRGVVPHYTELTGSGNVYPDDARNPDAFVLRPLARLSNPTQLASPLQVIRDDSTADAVGDSGSFIYPSGDPRIVQTNVYWHVDHFFNDFIVPLGHSHRYAIGVTVNALPGFNDPATSYANALSFSREFMGSDGSRWHNAGLVRDVIYHECGHIVLYDFGLLPAGETAALHEGLADFFAAAASDDPVIGEWLVPGCDAGLRDIASDPTVFRYGNYDHVFGGCGAGPGDPHSNGMILSGALWDLRQSLGPVTEAILVEALPYLASSATFADLAAAMLRADLDLRGGAQVAQIEDGFAGREIRIVDPGAVVSIGGRDDLAAGQSTTFEAFATAGWPPYRYQWTERRRAGPDSLEILDRGNLASATFSSKTSFDLTLEVTDALSIVSAKTKTVQVFGPDQLPPMVSPEVSGDSTASDGASEDYRVDLGSYGGLAPFTFSWTQHGLDCEGNETGSLSLGATSNATASVVTVRPDPDGFFVSVEVLDRYERSAHGRKDVRTLHACETPLLRAEAISSAPNLLRIWFTLDRRSRIVLAVFDVSGRLVARPFEGDAVAGLHTLAWDVTTAPSGVYFLRLLTPDRAATRRVVLRR